MNEKLKRGLDKAVFAISILAMVFCINASAQETTHITLGAVQSKVKVGASGDDVITAIGSPNIITSGDNGTETWVYDKLSIQQQDSVNANADVKDRNLSMAQANSGTGADTVKDGESYKAAAGVHTEAQRSRSEKTMMVVVKFDANKRVSNVQYRESTY